MFFVPPAGNKWNQPYRLIHASDTFFFFLVFLWFFFLYDLETRLRNRSVFNNLLIRSWIARQRIPSLHVSERETSWERDIWWRTRWKLLLMGFIHCYFDDLGLTLVFTHSCVCVCVRAWNSSNSFHNSKGLIEEGLNSGDYPTLFLSLFLSLAVCPVCYPIFQHPLLCLLFWLLVLWRPQTWVH